MLKCKATVTIINFVFHYIQPTVRKNIRTKPNCQVVVNIGPLLISCVLMFGCFNHSSPNNHCYFLFLQPVQEKGNRFPNALVSSTPAQEKISLAKTGTTITSNKQPTLFFGLNGVTKHSPVFYSQLDNNLIGMSSCGNISDMLGLR